MERETVARLLTGVGVAVVLVSMFLLPWSRGGDRYLEFRPRLADFYTYADFNAKLAISYHAWGYLLFVAGCVAAWIAVYRGRVAMTIAAVAVAFGAIWHQIGIGTVANLAIGAYLPELGAALAVIGRVTGIVEVASQKR
jgi:hypothetical protein